MNLTDWKDVTEIGKDVVSAAAIIIGGWWSYKKFFREADGEPSIEIKLECDVVATEDSGVRLLTIKSELCNNGKIPSVIFSERSIIDVYKINPDTQTRTLYCQCDYYKNYQTFNIPVNGKMNVLDYAYIEHPGIYHVNVFFAQSAIDNKKFRDRIKSVGASDAEMELSGWRCEKVVSSAI